jgi:hypothetical protein
VWGDAGVAEAGEGRVEGVAVVGAGRVGETGMSGPIRIVPRQAGKTAEMLAVVEKWRQRGYVIQEMVGAWQAWRGDSDMGIYLKEREANGQVVGSVVDDAD